MDETNRDEFKKKEENEDFLDDNEELETEEEPFKEKETESKEKKESKRKLKMHDFQYGHGPLKLENLQADNHVMRALEILMSYELFKGMQD